jgi:polysaccharide chain length determinant protein (PEP-CTERM system associated)
VLPGKRYSPEDFLRIVWRGKWIIVVPFVLSSVGTFFYVRQLPELYRSTTQIMVTPPRVPESLMKPTKTEKIEERVQAMRTQIVSRARLEEIVNDLNLYQKERKTKVMEDVIEQMRKEIGFDSVKGSTFKVSFISTSPVTAMKVAERLAQLFIDNNLREREALMLGANDFLSAQLEDARRRLIDHEKRLEAYRRAHVGELPDQLESNLSAISSTRLSLQSLTDALARDRDRRQTLQRMIADGQSPEAVAMPLTRMPSANAEDPATGTYAQQLEGARRSLAALELRLKPTHPDVTRMRRMVEELAQKADEEEAQRPVSSPELGMSPAERTRLGKIAEFQDELTRLNTTIAAREADEQKLGQMLTVYQARADAAPTRQTELLELNRDYNTIQSVYKKLLEQTEQAKMAASLESRQVGEQFRIIEPARVPRVPFSPNRERLNLTGAAAGLILGLVLVALREYRDTTLKSDSDVLVTLSLPVIGGIPFILTEDDVLRHRRRRFALVGVGAGVLAVVGVVVAVLAFRA